LFLLRIVSTNLSYTCLINTIVNNTIGNYRIRTIKLHINASTLVIISIIVILHGLVVTSHRNERFNSCIFKSSSFSWSLSFHDALLLLDVRVCLCFMIRWFDICVVIIIRFYTLSKAFHKISVLITFHVIIIYCWFAYNTILARISKHVVLV